MIFFYCDTPLRLLSRLAFFRMRNHWFVAIQQNLATPAFANFPIVSVAVRKSLETYPYHRSLRLSSSPLMLLSVLHRFSSTKHSLMEA